MHGVDTEALPTHRWSAWCGKKREMRERGDTKAAERGCPAHMRACILHRASSAPACHSLIQIQPTASFWIDFWGAGACAWGLTCRVWVRPSIRTTTLLGSMQTACSVTTAGGARRENLASRRCGGLARDDRWTDPRHIHVPRTQGWASKAGVSGSGGGPAGAGAGKAAAACTSTSTRTRVRWRRWLPPATAPVRPRVPAHHHH